MDDFRYISILTIFSSSILGSLSPFLINDSFTPFIKMFSSGVILSLSLVHIVPESINDLNIITEFPLGGTMVLIGLLFMIIIENVSNLLLAKNRNPITNTSIEHSLVQHSASTATHNHICVNNHNLNLENNHKTSSLVLHIFEFSCIFHSFIIGLSLGLLTEQDEIRKLMIALLFHQMIEGMSLGTMLLSSKANKLKSFIFITAYSLMTPLGITTGLIIEKTSSSPTELSINWIASRGCLLGISAGMLLYISLIQLIIEELSKKETLAIVSVSKKLCMYVSMLVGASIMCIFAIWA